MSLNHVRNLIDQLIEQAQHVSYLEETSTGGSSNRELEAARREMHRLRVDLLAYLHDFVPED